MVKIMHQTFKQISAILILLLILFALVGPAAAAPRNYVVVFMFDEENYYKKSVPRFTVMSEIETPIKDGYVFGGWYLDRAYKQPYDFNQPVNEPFYLYAKWIPDNSTEAVAWASLKSTPKPSTSTAANIIVANTTGVNTTGTNTTKTNTTETKSGSANNSSSTSSGSGSNAVLPIPAETISKTPASGRPDVTDPIASLPSPQTFAFLIIAGIGAAIVAYFLLLKN
ncbi:putative repeat protein (TIGR02543 family) [Methanimicrococcus blatticola]|uniref:Putative repeat protein (TIGR02543 family) n=2 Tax=Methanimicrococcus blatticola TaxID=91560 RepID=A0A484F5Z5_9EURY|nr:putative repeat protein (TIGR02543 family) [Methanimicrococcus blatticola]